MREIARDMAIACMEIGKAGSPLVPNENGHVDHQGQMEADLNMGLNNVVHFGGL
jgi:hypothetical protein